LHIKQYLGGFEPRGATDAFVFVLDKLVHLDCVVKICYFDHALVVPQNVGGFNVPMQNSALMEVLEALSNLL